MQSKDNFLQPKSAGVLLPVSALPDGAVGNFGDTAYRFVDMLSEVGVKYWQILPLCPEGKGFSPYSSVSAFAISPSYLASSGVSSGFADYRKAHKNAVKALKEAPIDRADFETFLNENSFWLDGFACFCAFLNSGKIPDFSEYKSHVTKEISLKADEIKREQYILRRQWDALLSYAENKGVGIIGDMPIYVAARSADVWANKSLFAVGNDLIPLTVAGVPPDIFSKTGQLWGNPVYDWRANRSTDFEWWCNRLKYNFSLYTGVRIDHFRAFSTYYAIPFGSKDATTGVWEYAVGKELFSRAKEILHDLPVIAEDLGGDTPDVKELLKFTNFPSMKVTQFAFDSDKDNQFLVHNHPKNCVCYTGTHDNDTAVGWYEKATDKERKNFETFVPHYGGLNVAERLVRYSADSKADLTVIPVQDFLSLDSSARINTPGVAEGNWLWRMTKEQFDALPEKIEELLKPSGRLKFTPSA